MRRPLALTLAGSLACAGVANPEHGAKPVVEPPVEALVPDRPPPRTASPSRPTFPLVVGDRWQWEIVRRTGAGLRILFMPTDPATEGRMATWALAITRRDGPRFHAVWTQSADGPASETHLTLWHDDAGELWMDSPQGPRIALERTVPPDPVAPEQVDCIAHFLGGLVGRCSPAPGGPLGVPPGPVTAIVSSDANAARTLLQIAVGLGTAGLVIPGNRTTTVSAQLVAYEPAAPSTRSPLVDAWQRGFDLSVLDRVPDREEAAAMVAVAPPPRLREVSAHVIAATSPSDRVPVVRVALLRATERLSLLAHLAPLVAPVEAPSVVALIPDHAEAATALLAGRWRTLRAVLTADPTDAARLAAMEGQHPEFEEAVAILGTFDDPARALRALPPEPRLLVEASRAQTFDDERLALLDGRLDLAARDPRPLLDTYAFDAGRAEALRRLLDASPPDQAPALLRVGVELAAFDDARLALLRAHPDAARALSRADREAVLAAFVFDDARAEARSLL